MMRIRARMVFVSLWWVLFAVGAVARGAGGTRVAGGAGGPRRARPVMRA